MTAYSIALFVHVVGAMLLFVTLSLEGVALRQVRRAATAVEAMRAAALLRLNRVIGPISLVGVLGAGLYMSATTWGWVPWIVVALAAYALIAVFGAVNGIRIVAFERTLAKEAGPVAQQVLDRLRNPLLLASWSARVGIAVGVVFLMTVKPGVAIAVLAVVIGAIAGVAPTLLPWIRGQSRQGQSV